MLKIGQISVGLEIHQHFIDSIADELKKYISYKYSSMEEKLGENETLVLMGGPCEVTRDGCIFREFVIRFYVFNSTGQIKTLVERSYIKPLSGERIKDPFITTRFVVDNEF